MADKLGPDPGFVFQRGAQQIGSVWITEAIRLSDLALSKVAAIADLNQTITNPPTQAEVQAISDKIDELLAAMRTAEKMEI
jgi:hypothetical protein